MNRKLIIAVLSISITFTSTAYVISSKELSKEAKYTSSSTMQESDINMVEVISVKSDGREVALVKDKSEIKKLLDMVKEKAIKESDVKEVEEVKLNSKITYEPKRVNYSEIKDLTHYVSNIVTDHDNNWSIKFDIKGYKEGDKWIPVSRGTISSSFGERWGRMHKGIDIAAPTGTPIYAVRKGKVIFSGWQDGYGKVIKIDIGEDTVIIYGHCSVLNVNKNDLVDAGEKIGEVGSTGKSTGPHLHFEVRKDNIPQNPEPYLKKY
ncbi:M23 family metallopeptidase [Clostridium peptidivorans]|uniref:M23 family metallopeptidase n=1 Tax=Clostridium peptidivorans TaxID=100174 RepID=UPI000BE3C6F9|nr:M23 family metallopeptidase [Clostridium peptidivorans]